MDLRNEKKAPWEGAAKTIYFAREVKPRSKNMKRLCLCLSIFLIFGGILTPIRISILFGILYLLATLMKKTVVLTERGIESFYQMRICNHYECIPWEEFTKAAEEDRNHKELMALYFQRGERVKRLFFLRSELPGLEAFVKQCNPGLKILKAEKSLNPMRTCASRK